jgi:hypothetical protein
MAEKSDLAVGQRVKFLRSHDKAVELIGRITSIAEEADLVDVVTEPDGKIVEVATTETVLVADITAFERKDSNGQEKETAAQTPKTE